MSLGGFHTARARHLFSSAPVRHIRPRSHPSTRRSRELGGLASEQSGSPATFRNKVHRPPKKKVGCEPSSDSMPGIIYTPTMTVLGQMPYGPPIVIQ
jgi:hypothetical protein